MEPEAYVAYIIYKCCTKVCIFMLKVFWLDPCKSNNLQPKNLSITLSVFFLQNFLSYQNSVAQVWRFGLY